MVDPGKRKGTRGRALACRQLLPPTGADLQVLAALVLVTAIGVISHHMLTPEEHEAVREASALHSVSRRRVV